MLERLINKKGLPLYIYAYATEIFRPNKEKGFPFAFVATSAYIWLKPILADTAQYYIYILVERRTQTCPGR